MAEEAKAASHLCRWFFLSRTTDGQGDSRSRIPVTRVNHDHTQCDSVFETDRTEAGNTFAWITTHTHTQYYTRSYTGQNRTLHRAIWRNLPSSRDISVNEMMAVPKWDALRGECRGRLDERTLQKHYGWCAFYETLQNTAFGVQLNKS